MDIDNKVNHLKVGELPTLMMVSKESLVFHEEPDRERLLNLVDRLGSEGVLKNPPIVARIKNDNQYVILDGANRVTALTKLGFTHFLVQVVDFDDESLRLHCWNHAIEYLDRRYFEKNIRKAGNIEIIEDNSKNVSADNPPDFSKNEGTFCHLTFNGQGAFYIAGASDLIQQVSILRKLTSLYLNAPDYDRVSYINLEHLKKHYPNFRTLAIFRRFQKEDFIRLTESGIKLPAGITRVFLPKRALGLNIPLQFLKSELTLEEKNRWLDEMILKRVRDKSIRFYREPTFVFDE